MFVGSLFDELLIVVVAIVVEVVGIASVSVAAVVFVGAK